MKKVAGITVSSFVAFALGLGLVLATVTLWPASRVADAAECDSALSCGPDMYCSYGSCKPGCLDNFNCSSGALCVREHATDVAGQCKTEKGSCQVSEQCNVDTQKCDMTLNQCVSGCDETSCSLGKRCSNPTGSDGKCISVNQDECQKDGDCQPTQFCETKVNPHRCLVLAKSCSRPEDCPGEMCDPQLKVCRTWASSRPTTPTEEGIPKLFCVSTVPELISAITEANKTHARDTVVLQPGTYTLTDPSTVDGDGPSGLPDITSPLLITAGDCAAPGNGRATIARADGAPPFRILRVASTGMLDLENVTIMGGRSSAVCPGASCGVLDGGGGILNRGHLTITNSTVTGNATENTKLGGGGILNSGQMVLVASTIAENSSFNADGGGGILNRDGDLEITNSTIAGNQVDFYLLGGGGILNENGGVFITNSTIARNRAVGVFGIPEAGGGGILNVDRGTVFIVNTIVAQNVASAEFLEPENSDCGNPGEGTIRNMGHNISNGSSCPFGDGTGVDPLLDTRGPLGLQDNGGPTQTIALLPGSPAIDKGDNAACPATDQRGVRRPFGLLEACDIGAFEFVGFSSFP